MSVESVLMEGLERLSTRVYLAAKGVIGGIRCNISQ
jgi:hypothetical protein